jgi:regulatory protein YycH of two-component signal transduction system YycFG
MLRAGQDEPRQATRGGGGERELNQILLQEPTYVPSSNPKAKALQKGHEHTNQQRRNDPLEVTNIAKKNGTNRTPR